MKHETNTVALVVFGFMFVLITAMGFILRAGVAVTSDS